MRSSIPTGLPSSPPQHLYPPAPPPRCAHPASFRSLPLGLKLDHNDTNITNDTGLYICIIRIGPGLVDIDSIDSY